jgi:hypothetical protein
MTSFATTDADVSRFAAGVRHFARMDHVAADLIR